MAVTPLTVQHRLSISYQAYAKPHRFRIYTMPFERDSGVGTFTAPGTPVSLDALATQFAVALDKLYTSDAALQWGEWIGEFHVDGSGESWVPITSGNVATFTPDPQTGTNPSGAPTQATWSFRCGGEKILRFEAFGILYFGSSTFRYSGIGGDHLAFIDMVLGNSRVKGRNNTSPTAFVALNFDTNDALQGKYRR